MKEEVFALTLEQRAKLAKLGVVLLYAHGSVAMGTARQDSDVDVAVLFHRMPEDPIEATGAIMRALCDFAPENKLDVAILNESSPLFKQIVASTGKLLYARSPDDALRFELRSMHEYEYSRHIVRLGQELVLKRMDL